MSDSRLILVDPPSLGPAPGFHHGVVVARGRTLYVAGQIATDAQQRLVGFGDMAAQFAQALDNVLTVVREAGGRPEDIAEMTAYCTDIPAYRTARKALGAAWRERLGRHYPAMALIGVTELVMPGAMIEIQAVAALPEEGPA